MSYSYYEVFQQRCFNKGLGLKQAVESQVEHNFQKFLKSSPNAIDIKLNGKGNSIRVATISNKENDTMYRRYFLCDKADNIKVGDFLYWEDTVWLVFKREIDTIDAYDKFDCIQCRHTIKWINSVGVLKETPCYLVAQTDEKIKSNFRTWNNMITPQPNKFMEIITSRNDIELGQKFLIDETAWFVVESDYISVKDILYLSLTEDKVDEYVDDVENNIANIIDLNKFELDIQSNEISLGIDEEYQLEGRIYLNGLFYSDDIEIEVVEGRRNIEIFENENGDLMVKGLSVGDSHARIFMTDHPDVYQDLTITISETAQEPIVTYELRGDASIKWGRTKVYQFVEITNGSEKLVPCTFTIEDSENLLIEKEIKSSSIVLTANEDNRTGMIKITVENENLDEPLVKEVKIVSLWM